MIREHDPVVLRRDLPEARLCAGDVGRVMHSHRNGTAYEVEFATLAGRTVALLTVPADALRPVAADEIAHVRRIA